jgi:hypothetical protein
MGIHERSGDDFEPPDRIQPNACYAAGVYAAFAKFDRYHPYVRYQYVNSPLSDPVNIFVGRYSGSSFGVRMDVAEYAAFKMQYNRLDQGPAIRPGNGLDMQTAFTF